MKAKKMLILICAALLCACTSSKLPESEQKENVSKVEESETSIKDLEEAENIFDDLESYVNQEITVDVRLPQSTGFDSQGNEAALAFDLHSDKFIILDGKIDIGGCVAELKGILDYNGVDYVLKLISYSKI